MGWLIDILPSLFTWAVTAALAALCGWLKGRLKRQDAARQAIEAEQEAMKSGLQAILHDRIYQAHRYYTQLGFCPLNDKKNIEYLFRPYAALGGNGTGKQAFDDIMNLPTEAAGGKEHT